MALLVLGISLVAAGILFIIKGVGKSDTLGGSAFGASLNVSGPTGMIVLGAALVVVQVAYIEQREPPKEAPSTITQPPEADTGRSFDDLDEFMADFPNGFTFGDDNDLDKLWRECDRGIWTSCDNLYFQSDVGSDYEYYGATCGELIPDPVDFCAIENQQGTP